MCHYTNFFKESFLIFKVYRHENDWMFFVWDDILPGTNNLGRSVVWFTRESMPMKDRER